MEPYLRSLDGMEQPRPSGEEGGIPDLTECIVCRAEMPPATPSMYSGGCQHEIVPLRGKDSTASRGDADEIDGGES